MICVVFSRVFGDGASGVDIGVIGPKISVYDQSSFEQNRNEFQKEKTCTSINGSEKSEQPVVGKS